MTAEPNRMESTSGEHKRQEPAHFLLAFAIGALVGTGLAAIWVPERRRRRVPGALSRRYPLMRKASRAALDEIRKAGQTVVGEFREELGASVEAAREELKDMARHQLDHVHQALRREQRKLGRPR